MTRFLLTIFVLSFVIGCSTENPLCTDNYCVTGEVFSKDELEAGQTFEVLPIDEASLVTAIDAATVQDGTDVVRRPKVEKTTPEEWETLIEEQGKLPVLELITVTDTLRIQVAERPPTLCVSLNDEVINGVSYTAHRSTWIRDAHIITRAADIPFVKVTSNTRSREIIASTISEGEICGIKATEIKRNRSVPNRFWDFDSRTEKYTHTLVVDMTVDGLRQLWVSPSTIPQN